MSARSRARVALQLARAEGPEWLAWRGLYEACLRGGWFERALPAGETAAEWLARDLAVPASDLPRLARGWWERERGPFFLSPGLSGIGKIVHDPDDAAREARAILGTERAWLRGERGEWRADAHWSRVRELSEEDGDVKAVWEPSRFAHTFRLARAYAVLRDEEIAEAWWRDVESWSAANPLARGPNWRCGQELALRALAWTFGAHAFASRATDSRLALLFSQLHAHGRHVERMHWYAARCVRNNHAISEALGLLAIGTVFPFLPDAARWRATGRAWLAHEVAWQVAPDGSYVQQSHNYARMAAQLLAWSLHVARPSREPLPPVVRERATALLAFLRGMVHAPSGRAPNYGHNDGTLLFPLTSCGYGDYRPALADLAVALGETPREGTGPWLEQAAWATGEAPRAEPPAAPRAGLRAFADGGYYRLDGRGTHAFVRCARYRHRPAHADQLHLDVWYGDANVLADAGTYSYNAPAPWTRHFVSTAAHNTVTVDGRDQMEKGPRFTWLRFAQGDVEAAEATATGARFVGRHDGYAPVIHRRSVDLDGDVYRVVDDLVGAAGPRDFTLRWLVGDASCALDGTDAELALASGARLLLRVAASSPTKLDVARGDAVTPRGWRSLRYREKEPASSLAATVRAEHARFVTLLGPAAAIRAMEAPTVSPPPATHRHP